LGYSKLGDKEAKREPKNTLYDDFFSSKVHKSKELAKRIDGTRSHIITKRMQEERKLI
jgi:N-acetyl-beta-hexosaminidase